MRTYFTHTHTHARTHVWAYNIYYGIIRAHNSGGRCVRVSTTFHCIYILSVYIYIYLEIRSVRRKSKTHSLRAPCLHKTVHVSGLGTGWKKKTKKNYKTKQSRFSSSSAAFYSQTLKPSKAINYTNRLRVTAKIYLLSALFILLLLLLLLLLFLYYSSLFFFFLWLFNPTPTRLIEKYDISQAVLFFVYIYV